ncbi:MAG: MFS transporter, partial [Promethearchaeota archaeon]
RMKEGQGEKNEASGRKAKLLKNNAESSESMKKTTTISLFTGNYLILVLSWILMDFAGELPNTYYSDYVVTLSGGDQYFGSVILGIITLVSFLCLASVQFLGGYMADKYGRRKLIVMLTFGVAFSYIFYAFAPSWHFILIGAAIQNLVLLYQPALLAMMADSVPPEKRGTGFSILNLIASVATTPAPIVALMLVGAFGSLIGMRIAYSVVVLFYTMAAIIRMRLTESMENVETMNFREAIRSYPKAMKEGIRVWRVVPRSTVFLLIASIIFRFAFSMAMTLFLVYAFYELQIGGTPNPMLRPEDDPALQLARIQWGYISIALFISMIILSLPIGKMIDKIGRKKPLIISGLTIIPSVLLFVYGNYPLLLNNVMIHLTIAIILFGFVQLLGFAASQAWFADLVPQEQRGKVMGSMNFFSYIFMAIGGLAGGVFYGYVSPQLPFLLMPVLIVPAMLLVAFKVHETGKEERES